MARWVKSKQSMRIFKTATTPTTADGLAAGDLWIDTTSTPVTKLCTATPSTFVTCADTASVTTEASARAAADTTLQTNIDLKAPLASPTFSGTIAMASGAKIVLDKSAGAEASNIITLNANCGTITSASLTTAAGGSYLITLTNNKIVDANSVIVASIAGGTNTVKDISVEAKCTAASTATLTIYNNVLITTALNGTVIINFIVV